MRAIREILEREAEHMFPIELDDNTTLQYDDVVEIKRLLNHPIRSRHTCISKGQLHEVIDQLIAHNVKLERQVKQLQKSKE